MTENLTDTLFDHAATRPSDRALITEDETLSWSELCARVNQAQTALAEQNITLGSRVGICTDNQSHHLFLSLALLRIGAAHVALPTATPPSENAKSAQFLELDAIVTTGHAPVFSDLRTISLDPETWPQPGPNPLPAAEADYAALFLKSSGTTGAPKFAELSNTGLSKRWERYKHYCGATPKDVFWAASRVDYVVAKQRILFALFSGACVLLTHPQQASLPLIDRLKNAGVTLACTTPAKAMQFANLTQSAGIALPDIRIFEVRSAIVSQPLREAFTKRVSPNLHVVYATNEAETITLASPDMVGATPFTVGRPTKSITVELVDKNGNPVAEGEAGFVRVKGPGVISTYWKNPDANAKHLAEGWFMPGDIARWQGDELIYLGRDDDLMIYDSENIYPAELEAALMAHPAVSDATAFPIRHEMYQDVPAAAVVAAQGTQENDLRRDLEHSLGHRTPARIFILDALPRNAMGKIDRKALFAKIEEAKKPAAAQKSPTTPPNIQYENITDAIFRHAAERPQDIAVITETQKFTWAMLCQGIVKIQVALSENHIGPGARVGISTTNQLDHLFIFLALLRVGAAQIALPMPDVAATNEAVADFLKMDAILVTGQAQDFPNHRVIRLDRRELHKEDTPALRQGTSEPHTALILKTSGTTGFPKFLELSNAALSIRCGHYIEAMEITHSDVFWPASRFDFISAKFRSLFTLVAGGRIALFQQRPADASLARDLTAAGVTVACSTPSIASGFLSVAPENGFLLPTVRIYELCFTLIPEPLRTAFKARVTPYVYIAYSTSESWFLSLARPQDVGRIPSTVGTINPAMQLELVDQRGHPVPEGENGLVRVKGPGTISGYVDNPAATARHFVDGWFYPGDVGQWNAGHLVLLGRFDDMMICDGENIYPAELENVLVTHPSITDAVAFPIEHALLHQVPGAAVVVSEDVTEARLLKDMRRELGRRAPVRIFFFDTLPRNPGGKFDRKALYAEVAKRLNA